MQIAMRGSVSMLVVIPRTAGTHYRQITQGGASWATLTTSRDLIICGIRSGSTRPTGAARLGSPRFLMGRKRGFEWLLLRLLPRSTPHKELLPIRHEL